MEMRTTLQRYARAVRAAPTLDAAMDVVSETATEFGFTGASALFWPRAWDQEREPPPPAVRVIGSHVRAPFVPWVANYLQRGLFKSDFVLRACRVTSMPVVWSYDSRPEIVLRVGQTATHGELLGIEQMFALTGVRGGVSVPIRGRGAFFGYVVFTYCDRLETLISLAEDHGDQLLAVTHRFYDAMVDKVAACVTRERRLTGRELECLLLLAIGKTLEEVAMILGVSYGTVRFHLQNAKRKLGAVHRAHAIARAAFLGVLGPLD